MTVRFQAVVSPFTMAKNAVEVTGLDRRLVDRAIAHAASCAREAREALGGPIVLDEIIHHPTHPRLVWRKR